MRAEPIKLLARLRSTETEAAKRALADAMSAQATTERAEVDAIERIRCEAEIALDTDAGDGQVEAYVRWLPAGRRAVAIAATRRAEAAARVDVARVALGLARAAEQAVADAITALDDARAREAERRAQNELDDRSSLAAAIGGRTGAFDRDGSTPERRPTGTSPAGERLSDGGG